MKTKSALLLLSVLCMVLTLTLSGQTTRTVKKKNVIKNTGISSVLGKPVYQSTVDSLTTKVWIVSQKKNKELRKTKMGKTMSSMKDRSIVTEKETKEAMTAGTHYFILDVMNIRTGKIVADSSAKVEVVSPTRRVSSVQLLPMMNHFGGGVFLEEKGEYLFTVNVDVGADYKTTQFKYKVK